MARALRIEHPGGRYHVTARGNERKSIFRDDRDRFHFLELLSGLGDRFGAKVHAYVLMENHFHLLVETPEANLSRAMQWANVSYSVWFNRRHNRVGHLFQGRFSAIIVEDDPGWQELSRYVHLNPVRITILGLGKSQRAASRAGPIPKPAAEIIAERLNVLRGFRWSSYRGYAGYCAPLPWVCREPIARLCGGNTDSDRRAALREYTEQAVRLGAVERPWGRLLAGVVLGTEAFAQRLRRKLRCNPREQAQFKALTRPVAWARIVCVLEMARGEAWEQLRNRHGDWSRDAALWLGRRQGRLSLAQLGSLAGGMDYAAVGQALSRFAKRLEREPALQREIAKLEKRNCQMLRCDPDCPPPIAPPLIPVDLKLTPNGNICVLSRSTQTIAEYTTAGTLVRSLAGIGQNPNGIEVDAGGNVYVAVTGEHQVRKFNPTANSFQGDMTFNGSWIGKADKAAGTANGEFNAPFDVAITPEEEIAISDSGNHRIQRFTKFGVFLEAYGTLGSGPGQFNTPKGLCYAEDGGYLYIADSGNNRVVLANSAGYCGASGVVGSALGQFQGLANLSAGSRGIYVADAGNNRVQVFDTLPIGDSATFLPLIARCALAAELSLNHPASITTVKDYLQEKLYIADTGNNRVILVSLPADNPESVWNAMKQQLVAGNISAAVPYFSTTSAEKYRASFLAIGATDLVSIMSQIGSISPVSTEAHTAQYRFDQVVQGVTLTFPIEFVKENGIWKILEF